MKRIIWLMLYLNMNGVFADVNDVVSRQINGQIVRSTSNSISRNIDYRQINSAPVRRDYSAPNTTNNYQQDDNVSDSNEMSPSSHFPTYSYPKAKGLSR